VYNSSYYEQHFNFLSDFDVQVFSYEVGFNKPDPKIFQALIDRSGVLPSELFYADDNQSCVDAAKSLGISESRVLDKSKANDIK